MDAQSGNRRRTRERVAPKPWPWAALTAVLVVLATLMLWNGWSARSERVAGDDAAATSRFYALRAELAWLHHGLLVDGLLAELEGEERPSEWITDFRRRRADLVDEIDEIAGGSSVVAPIASEMVEIHRGWAVHERPLSAVDLDEQHYLSVSSSVDDDSPADHSAYRDLIVATMLPAQVLTDALSLQLSRTGDDVSPWAAAYVATTVDVVRSNPGWLGPDRTDPLSNAAVIDPSAANDGFLSIELSEAVNEDLRLVWDYDSWLVTTRGDNAEVPEPMTIAELERAATSALEGIRAEALLQLADEPASNESRAGGDWAAWWFGLSAAAGVAAFGAATNLVRHLRNGHRLLADDAMSDPLTEARNRRFLDNIVAGRCRRIGFHHVVAVIDLDRFKLVNDTWGHAVGDFLLVTLVERLNEAAIELTERWQQGCAAVVRTGGDEFLVALHVPDQLSLELVEARLRSITGPIDLGVGEPVLLDFSLGIADAGSPVDVADLLRQADAASYEDKRLRAGERLKITADPDLTITFEHR